MAAIDPHDVRSLTDSVTDQEIFDSYINHQDWQYSNREEFGKIFIRYYGVNTPLKMRFAAFAWGNHDGNKISPNHFTMEIFKAPDEVVDFHQPITIDPNKGDDSAFKIYISHAEKGQDLIRFINVFHRLKNNKSEEVENWPGSAVILGEFVDTPKNVLMTVLRWWYYNDVMNPSETYPASCSGSVGTVLWNHCQLLRRELCPRFFYKNIIYGKMSLPYYKCNEAQPTICFIKPQVVVEDSLMRTRLKRKKLN